MGRVLAWGGGIGAVTALLCCVTSLLPAILTALGASALIDTLWRDAVLLPIAAVSAAVMGMGLWLMRKTT